MARWVLLPLLCSLSLIITGAQADVPTLSDALTATADLSTLHDLLTSQYPDLLKKLEASDSKSPITLCAPSNAAFDKIQNSDIVGPALANNDTATVENILNYHVIPGEHTSKTLTSSFQFLRTLLVDPSETGVSGGQRVAAVLQSGDPPEIVFVSGEGTRAVVSQQDIASREGKRLYQRPHERGRLTRPVIRRVIQVIDYFLIPPQPFVDTASRFGLADEAHSVTSFLGAVYSLPDKAIATYLNTTQNVTIFVPDNIAMETVSGALAAIVEPIYSANFTNGTTLATHSGHDLQILFNSNSFFINSARVLTSDLLLSNGVMHIIDNVLQPNATTALPNPTLATQVPVLPTTGGTFNRSAAPYTTFAPGWTDSAAPLDAVSTTGDGAMGTLSSTSTGAAHAATATKKSGSAPPRDWGPLFPVPALVAGVVYGIM